MGEMTAGMRGAGHGVPSPNMTLLVFRNEDADAVLSAMRGELTSDRGFTGRDQSGLRDQYWWFGQEQRSPTGNVQIRNQAFYITGLAGATVEQAYERRSLVTRTPPLIPDHGECVVMLLHDQSWLDSAARTLGRWLHLS